MNYIVRLCTLCIVRLMENDDVFAIRLYRVCLIWGENFEQDVIWPSAVVGKWLDVTAADDLSDQI